MCVSVTCVGGKKCVSDNCIDNWVWPYSAVYALTTSCILSSFLFTNKQASIEASLCPTLFLHLPDHICLKTKLI
jgi:hypothetical protein